MADETQGRATYTRRVGGETYEYTFTGVFGQPDSWLLRYPDGHVRPFQTYARLIAELDRLGRVWARDMAAAAVSATRQPVILNAGRIAAENARGEYEDNSPARQHPNQL